MKPIVAVLDAGALGDTDWSFAFNDFTLRSFISTCAEECLTHAADAQYILTSKVIFGEKEFSQLPALRYIGVMATGVNNIDLEAAKRHGVTVTNIPGYSTASVAQYVFAFINEHMLKFSRQISFFPKGIWNESGRFALWHDDLREFSGMTIGLIGLGAIGSAVARIARAYNMRVIACTPSGNARGTDVEMVDFDTLLRESDIISLHCPLTASNRGMIGREALSKMKPGVFLINTARGPLIDESALAEALEQGIISGAGLDVMCTEPPAIDNPLMLAPNLIVTPHQAWATLEARGRLLTVLAENLRQYLAGTPQNKVC